jgi:hypothetical protein
MDQADRAAVAYDIALLEQMGYTPNEALDLLIRRALRDERDVRDDRSGRAGASHRAYLAELRGMCRADAA